MHTLSATFDITTPMFIGGYDNNAETTSIDVRPTAIKGALRFWWRALHYAEFRQQAPNSQKALQIMHLAEQKLFGGAASEKLGSAKTGQSLFFLRITKNIATANVITPDKDISAGFELGSPDSLHGLIYLLGTEIYSSNEKKLTRLRRPYIAAGTQFSLQIAFKPGTEPAQIAQIKRTVLAFGLLGNLGARARKGFGSISIKTYTEQGNALALPDSKENYVQALQELFASGQQLIELPPFTAFSAHSMADLSVTGSEPVRLLDQIGAKQHHYRSYGSLDNNGQRHVNGKEPLQLFGNDHDTLYHFVRDRQRPTQPRKLVFGLPHHVSFSNIEGNREKVVIKNSSAGKTRRASPLFIHIHKIGTQYYAVQSLLAAQFFPAWAPILYKINKNNYEILPKESVDWSVITDYLSMPVYQGKQHQYEGFTHRKSIFKGSQL